MPELNRRGFLLGLGATALTPLIPTPVAKVLPGCWDGVDLPSPVSDRSAYWYPTIHTDWLYGWNAEALVDWQRVTLSLQSTVFYAISDSGDPAPEGECI